ncbi:MAG TPA: hypothetical protein VMM79_21505 [Longimicrobiales bacterium]|nr:hypothetical protein [Longimicrobiales bacterium]
MRVSHSWVQHLNASPEAVFSLLCPVRETEWVNGWDPELVLSHSGVAEPGCIFIMPGGTAESIWVTTEYAPAERIAFLKVTPGRTVGEIDIRLRREGEAATALDVTYTYTALNPAGEDDVGAFTAAAYRAFMEEWERELGHFLETGEKLAAEHRT